MRLGSDVLVERGAGLGIGISDDDYRNAGAGTLSDVPAGYSRPVLIVLSLSRFQSGGCDFLFHAHF